MCISKTFLEITFLGKGYCTITLKITNLEYVFNQVYFFMTFFCHQILCLAPLRFTLLISGMSVGYLDLIDVFLFSFAK